jgi:hypothetical protein
MHAHLCVRLRCLVGCVELCYRKWVDHQIYDRLDRNRGFNTMIRGATFSSVPLDAPPPPPLPPRFVRSLDALGHPMEKHTTPHPWWSWTGFGCSARGLHPNTIRRVQSVVGVFLSTRKKPVPYCNRTRTLPVCLCTRPWVEPVPRHPPKTSMLWFTRKTGRFYKYLAERHDGLL